MRQVSLLELLVVEATDLGYKGTPELAAAFPRTAAPIPPEFATATIAVVQLNLGHVFARRLSFGAVDSVIALTGQHWVVAVSPAKQTVRLVALEEPAPLDAH